MHEPFTNHQHMKGIKLKILLLLQVLCLLSHAQKIDIAFNHLSTSEGLSQNSVFAILKDYKGFMWFATDEGLNKYDGYKFTVYKHDPKNPTTISGSSISGVLEDKEHQLWIASSGGIDRFDRTRESFIHYSIAGSDVVFRNIFQDSKGRLWLASNTGFCLFDTKLNTSKFYRNNPASSNSLSHNFVYRITEDNHGELWIATRNGLNRFNPQTGNFTRYYNDPANSKSLGSGYIKTVFKDSRGNIWAGTQGSGIALFNRADQSFTNYRHNAGDKKSLAHNDILSFTEDARGNLWVGTENGGISTFNHATKNFTNYINNESDPLSISANSIHCLYTDNLGNIWVGTWSGGINFMPFFGNKFGHYRKIPFNNSSLSNNLVLSISGDSSNNVWIGTDGGGLNLFNRDTQEFTAYRHDQHNPKSIYNDYVLSVTEYMPGLLALGFHRGGIDLFDIKKNSFTHYEPHDNNSNRITPISINIVYKDKANNLWLGTNDNGGLYLFNNQTKGFTNFSPDPKNPKSLRASTVYSMYESKNGKLWIGGDKGLNLFNRLTNTFTHFQHDPENANSLSNNTVYAISEDSIGNLWVGTAGGLNYFDVRKGTFKSYTEKEGLPNNTIWGILQETNGNLWVSTNKGLSRLTPSSGVFRNYTISDGLQNNTFKPKACYRAPNGEMYFGGVNGFNVFYPDRIRENDFVPPVYFTNFQVFNKPVGIGGKSPLKQSVNEVKEITLAHTQSVFTIEFAALNFTHPEQNHYAYKLEGFDADWIDAGNKRSATYTNLSAGTYIFRVRGSNNDGVWNDTGATLTIIITPPFWLTWWFMLLVFGLIAGSVIAFYWFRMNIIQKQKILLEKKVNEQTIALLHSNEEEHKARLEAEHARAESEIARQQVNRSNEELQTKNKELEQFAYVASHDLQEPLRTTLGFVELLQKQYNGKLDEKADKYLAFILAASNRMKTLIKDLLDFSRIGTREAMETVDCADIMKNVLADIEVAIKETGAVIEFEELPVIKGYPTAIKLLFQNLLINAIKFRKAGLAPLVKVTVKRKNNFWEFAVSDNGIGMDPQYGERIFDIFQRLHTRSEYDGSGIGLAHCKKIVELHQGKIWVQSVPGEGSTFYFTLFIHQQPSLIGSVSPNDIYL